MSKPDILWQHDNGDLQIWFMDGHKIKNRTGLVDEQNKSIQIAPPWRIVATGDFNSDGRPDILWQHDNGDLQIWFMDGHKIKNRLGLANENNELIQIAPPWNLVATGDFNSDGRMSVEGRAALYNSPPFPLGLPIDGGGNPVAVPIVTREPDGTSVARFRGGLVRERTSR